MEQRTSQSQESENLAETPQIMEISSSTSEPMRTQDQPDSNPVSVKSAPIVTQDLTMQFQSNMSEFLKASAARNNLLDRLMANIDAHMQKNFEAYLKQVFNFDFNMIECFNVLLLSDAAAFESFINSDLEVKFNSIPYQAISHPAIVLCVLLAVAYESLYKEIAHFLNSRDSAVIRYKITQKMVLDEIKRATQGGQLALIKKMVTLRLKDHFGIVTQRSSAQSSHCSRAQKSLKAYRSLFG